MTSSLTIEEGNTFERQNRATASVTQSCQTLCDLMKAHARLPCPSSTPGDYSNSCPLNRWCHPTISSSVIPFSSCLQSFPATGSFPLSQFLHQVAKVLAHLYQLLEWLLQKFKIIVGDPCDFQTNSSISEKLNFLSYVRLVDGTHHSQNNDCWQLISVNLWFQGVLS